MLKKDFDNLAESLINLHVDYKKSVRRKADAIDYSPTVARIVMLLGQLSGETVETIAPTAKPANKGSF